MIVDPKNRSHLARNVRIGHQQGNSTKKDKNGAKKKKKKKKTFPTTTFLYRPLNNKI
jgi:hypothetical protein